MMRAQTDPRRIYTRNDITHVCFKGTHFSPGREGTALDAAREVKLEELPAAGGKQRVEVTQRVGGKNVKETWRQVEVPVKHREVTQ